MPLSSYGHRPRYHNGYSPRYKGDSVVLACHIFITVMASCIRTPYHLVSIKFSSDLTEAVSGLEMTMISCKDIKK